MEIELDLDGLREACAGLASAKAPARIHRVAAWLTSHLPEVAWNTVDEIARLTETSPATVVRTLQRLGFSGYSELQSQVRTRLPRGELVWKLARASPPAKGVTTLGKIIDQERDNLNQLEAAVGSDLSALTDLLLRADRIFVTASLTTVPLAKHLTVHLDLLLGNVQFAEAATARSYAMLASLRAGDLVMGLSFPRYARATLETVAVASQYQAVLLTDRGGPMIPQTQLTLRLPAVSNVHFSSSVALVTVTMALARLLHDASKARVEENLECADQTWTRMRLLSEKRGARRQGNRNGDRTDSQTRSP